MSFLSVLNERLFNFHLTLLCSYNQHYKIDFTLIYPYANYSSSVLFWILSTTLETACAVYGFSWSVRAPPSVTTSATTETGVSITVPTTAFNRLLSIINPPPDLTFL